MNTRCIVVLLAVCLLLPAAQAQPEGRRGQSRPGGDRAAQRAERGAQRRERGPRMDLNRIREALNLDEDQQAEFDRIAEEFRQNSAAAETDNVAHRRELMEQLRAAREANDEARVTEIREQLRATHGDRLDEFFDQIKPILHGDQLQKLDELRQQMASRPGAPGARAARDPLTQLKRLRDELHLSDAQAQPYDAAYNELKTQLEQSRARSPEVDELIKELMKAAEAGDQERIKELRDQLPDPRAQFEDAIAGFFDKLGGFLTPEQMQVAEQTQEQMAQRPGRGRQRFDLRDVFRFASRLDLDETQREALRTLQRDSRERQRAARGDPAARADLTSSVVDELRGILNPAQQTQFDEWVAQQKSERGPRERKAERPPRPNRGGKPAQRGPAKPQP